MPIERAAWDAALAGGRSDNADLTLQMPLNRGTAGSSGAFLALAGTDRYWVKPLNNFQSPRVCVNEQIVGRAAALLCDLAPVVKTIRIPPGIAGWEFRSGRELKEGIAHGSRAVSNATETRTLENRDKDDNERHHAEVLGIYDWCWGGDAQWLTDQAADQRCYSHDHGHYFPGGPAWTAQELEKRVDDPNTFHYQGRGFTRQILTEIADKFDAISHAQIVSVLKAIPSSWPVTDQELESVGFFLERRARSVGFRLRERAGV
jgi:hypothetical protein